MYLHELNERMSHVIHRRNRPLKSINLFVEYHNFLFNIIHFGHLDDIVDISLNTQRYFVENRGHKAKHFDELLTALRTLEIENLRREKSELFAKSVRKIILVAHEFEVQDIRAAD